MIVLVFVLLLAVYTFSIVKIANLDAIINVSTELATILFACAFALAMILIIKILQDRIRELDDKNYELNKQIIFYKNRKD